MVNREQWEKRRVHDEERTKLISQPPLEKIVRYVTVLKRVEKHQKNTEERVAPGISGAGPPRPPGYSG